MHNIFPEQSRITPEFWPQSKVNIYIYRVRVRTREGKLIKLGKWNEKRKSCAKKKRVAKATTLNSKTSPISKILSEPFAFLPLIDDCLILVEIDNFEHHD